MMTISKPATATATSKYGRIVGRTTPTFSEQVDFSNMSPRFDNSRNNLDRTEEEHEAYDEELVRWEALRKHGMRWVYNDPEITAKLIKTGVIAPNATYRFLPSRPHYSLLRDFKPEDLNVNFW
jgi:hypothetical protein